MPAHLTYGSPCSPRHMFDALGEMLTLATGPQAGLGKWARVATPEAGFYLRGLGINKTKRGRLTEKKNLMIYSSLHTGDRSHTVNRGRTYCVPHGYVRWTKAGGREPVWPSTNPPDGDVNRPLSPIFGFKRQAPTSECYYYVFRSAPHEIR